MCFVANSAATIPTKKDKHVSIAIAGRARRKATGKSLRLEKAKTYAAKKIDWEVVNHDSR
jgi:hypothetical protein